MPYQVSRNGQTYGPYTLEDLQRYVASGNIASTDLAKSEDMPDWIPVSQIIWDETEVAAKGDVGTMAITQWIAREKGLD